VLLGGPGGGFTGSTAVVSGSQALGGLSSVAVGDFNRDGDPDLVVAHRSGNQVRVLLGGPGGSFGSPRNLPTGALPASVAVADFNADGKPDLATTHPTTNTVAVLLNTTVTNRAPAATDDAYTTAEDTPLSVAAPGVLGNDSDPDGDGLTAVLVSRPAHGTLTLNANGSFSYAPDADYNGPDSFTYKANDGRLESNTATVTLTVTAFNSAELMTKTQAMDGDLKVPPGSEMQVGYSFTIPGAHPTATIGFVGAKVTFNVTCTIGTPSSSTFVVAIPEQSDVDPQNSSAWYPSGDQNSALTYQGSGPVPTCSDPSALIRLQQGGTFSATVTSGDVQVPKVNVRWHYKGVTGSGGGWSATYSVIPH
jgi:VCBS repeat-containing protein